MTNERQLFNQLLDGGATETDRPYFVMELVKGVPITEFCNEHNLGTVGRICAKTATRRHAEMNDSSGARAGRPRSGHFLRVTFP
jgi:hypothetical protein